MSRHTTLMASIVGAILIFGVIGITNLGTVNAEDKNFKVDVRDDFRMHIDKLNGGINIDFKGVGNGGGGSTVYQTARDGVNELRAEDVSQNAKVDALTEENQGLKQNLSDAQSQISSLQGDLTTVNTELTNIKAQIANLTNTNPVIDVDVTNGTSTGGDNGTGTGGSTGNGTDTGGGTGGNGTGTGGNGTDTGGSGNGTGTTGNGTDNGGIIVPDINGTTGTNSTSNFTG